jgi:hypothetical protein
MNEYIQWINLLLLLVLAGIVDRTIKRPLLRRWLGFYFLVAGPALLLYATSWIREAQLESLPIIAFVTGIGLLSTQNIYCRAKTHHPLFIAPTLNLAPDFPDDPLMLHLLQILHEGIGLPKHKTITLDTSVNHDLGCNSAEAKQLMALLKLEFGMRLGDYNDKRYFKRRGFDAYLRYVEKGSEGKRPLTIGMLYHAVKAKSWDTQALETKGYQKP